MLSKAEPNHTVHFMILARGKAQVENHGEKRQRAATPWRLFL